MDRQAYPEAASRPGKRVDYGGYPQGAQRVDYGGYPQGARRGRRETQRRESGRGRTGVTRSAARV